MRVLVFVGSPRKNGNSYKLGKELVKQLKEAGNECECIHTLSSVLSCKACYKCADTHYCIRQDEWFDTYKAFNYDAVIIISPIYFFGLTSQAKAFLDRLGSIDWRGLKVGLITASGSSGYLGGHDLVEESIKRSCIYNFADYIGSYNKVTYDKLLEVDETDKENIAILLRSLG